MTGVEKKMDGSERFCSYLRQLAENGFKARTPYPGLPAKAWHEAGDFPAARALESEFPAIAREAEGLHPDAFHPESERIERVGRWDVCMLYERGRKHMEHALQCPVTTRIIEHHATVRTQAGLMYFSRMKPGTHVAPHRGPTNVRLRCHLGIRVPDGDCGIKVGGQARRWTQGRCLVFDDSLLHEAWNHADEERLVLIVDLWHPDLSATEVELLRGLHQYAFAEAHSLHAYWVGNRTASAGARYD